MEILKRASSPVLLEEKTDFLYVIKTLKETLKKLGGGAGLAAPQIGIFQNVFIWSKDRSEENIKVAINPTLIPVEKKGKTLSTEACFSIENNFYLIERWKEIRVMYYNDQAKMEKQKLSGFEAIVFQHEYDHLIGKLISCKGKLLKNFSKPDEYQEFLKETKSQQLKNK